MATVTTDGIDMRVELHGWERAWAMRRRIVVPLGWVASIERSDPKEAMRPRGLRAPGSYLPRVIAAGSYWTRRGWSFWSVRHRDRAVAIRLREGRYRKIVVDVDDPDATVREVGAAIGQVTGYSGIDSGA
jgi:hypothetical protein